MSKRARVISITLITFLLLSCGAGAYIFSVMPRNDAVYTFPQSLPFATEAVEENKFRRVQFFPGTKVPALTEVEDGETIKRTHYASDGTPYRIVVLKASTRNKLWEGYYAGRALLEATRYRPDGSLEARERPLGQNVQRTLYALDATTVQTVQILTKTGEVLSAQSFRPDGKIFSTTMKRGANLETTWFDASGDRMAQGTTTPSGGDDIIFLYNSSGSEPPATKIVYRNPKFGNRQAVYLDTDGAVEHHARWYNDGSLEITQYSTDKSVAATETVLTVQTRQLKLFTQQWSCLKDKSQPPCQYKLQSVTQYAEDGSELRRFHFDVKTAKLTREELLKEGIEKEYRADGTLARINRMQQDGYDGGKTVASTESVPAENKVLANYENEWLEKQDIPDPADLIKIPEPE